MSDPHPNRYGGIDFPDGFLYDPYEQLQDTLLFVHNRRVREEFRDLSSPDEIWTANLNTPRSRLRIACTMKDEDSGHMTMMRMWLFYVILGKAKEFQTPIYGIPVPSFQEARQFRPQIQLYFQEDYRDIEPGYAPITGEVSFRLMNETSETLTEAELTLLANKIKLEFGANNGYVWQKGRSQVTYTDRQRGYSLRVLCRTKASGRALINKVLDLQNHSPDWEKANVSENEEPAGAYPIVPPTDFILGRSRRLPRKRPVADVRFQYAMAHIWGMPHPIVLYDRSMTFRNPLVRATS